ncbi:MAG TPA: hypothetical protein PL126_04840 [Candidatus Cloacimonadota bacterium]|nr:hypothetical protein [Candidatus Cloacimonadota bacterium]
MRCFQVRFVFALSLFLLLAVCLNGEYSLIAKSRYVSIYGSGRTAESTLRLRQELDEGIDEIQMQTGVYVDGGPDIYIVGDDQAYKLLTQEHQGIVEFSDAFYSSYEKRVWVKPLESLKGNYIKVLIHEYTHWYLDQLFDGATLWFHEGMACLFANQLSLESYVNFTRDCFFGTLADLFRMGYQYPESPAQWQSYYLSSLFAVTYLQENYPEGWKTFWHITSSTYKAGQKTPFIAAFNYSFHTTLFDFNRHYQDYLKQKAWKYLFIGVNSLIFSLLPLVLLIAYIIKRKRMKQLPDLPLPQDVELEPPQEDS